MKAQHAFGLDLSWRRATPVFLLDVAVLVLAGCWPGEAQQVTYAWWSGVGVAVLVTLIALVTYHRIPLSSALVARALDRFASQLTSSTGESTQALDHRRRYSRESVGIRESHGQLVSVIAVDGRPTIPSGRHHRGTESTALLPVEMVATGLRQFDVQLDTIDIVSVGRGGDEEDAGTDDDTAGDAPEVTDAVSASVPRSTWLVLRMDPQRNVAGVAARDSVAATLAAATEQVAHHLDGRHIIARVLSAEEFAEVDTAVLADLRPGDAPESRRHRRQKQPKRYVTSLWVTPRDICSENLERLWRPHADTTVVTIRLTPLHGRTEVSVLVRYDSSSRLHKNARAGLNRFIGRRSIAVNAALPVPIQHPEFTVPSRELLDQEQLSVRVDPAPDQLAAAAGAHR